jgi:hypothetical protein
MNLKKLLKNKLTDSQRKQIRSIINFIKSIGRGNDLTYLAKIYRSDKWGWHSYTRNYAHHFRKYRYKRIKLLEIGAGGYDDPKAGGESLRMWKRYFLFANIYSIDIYEKSFLEEKRIKIFKGSQVDAVFLKDITGRMGTLDIIIDDGSHVNEHVVQTFKLLFPVLNDGGIYVVEDTQTSYWETYGGDSINLNNPGTTMGFFKNLSDGLNYKELIRPGYEPSYFDKHITSVHFYHNLIFVYKGENVEESNLIKNNEKQSHISDA